MKYYSVILIILFSTVGATAQQRWYTISYSNNGSMEYETLSGTTDSLGFRIAVHQAINTLMAKGYLLANADYIDFDDTLRAEINIGEQYRWQAMGVKDIPEEMLSKTGYRSGDFTGRFFSLPQFKKLMTKLTTYAANTGYPFAAFILDDIEINKQSIKGKLVYHAGPEIRYDSLSVRPGTLVKAKFLESYLNVREGDFFRISDLDNLNPAIEQLAFCKLADSLSIGFQNKLCSITVPLEAIRANRVDAIIGFLPNQKNNSGLRLTGFVNLDLQNLFRSGKSLGLVWQQFNDESQKLEVNYRHPNVLGSQIGAELAFNLIKQDTSFLNTRFSVNGFYRKNKVEISFTTDIRTSRTLAQLMDSLSIPAVIDNDLQQFGLHAQFTGVRNTTNPLRGVNIKAAFKLGTKQIRKVGQLNEAVYDSLNLNPTQLEATLGTELYQRVAGPFLLYMDLRLATLYNNDALFTNDLIRLGGINSLRGFNDLELFVSSYFLGRIEARLTFSKDSRLFVFYDQSFTENKVSDYHDAPFGFGAGLQLQTGGGELQLVYALGVSRQQSLSLSQSKIHIGYVARF